MAHKLKKKYKGVKYYSQTMDKMIEVSEKKISILVKDKQKDFYVNSKESPDESATGNGN